MRTHGSFVLIFRVVSSHLYAQAFIKKNSMRLDKEMILLRIYKLILQNRRPFYKNDRLTY